MSLLKKFNLRRGIEFFKSNRFVRGNLLKLMINSRFPPFLFTEPTNNCNLKCSFCPRMKSNKKVGNMSMDLYKKVIDESLKYGKRWGIGFVKDGDGLLHPELGKMIKYAKEKKSALFTHLTTNAVALSERKSLEILESGLDDLRISLDAATPETYEKIKGVQCFELVEKNVNRFLEIKKELGAKKPFVRIKIIRMKETEKEIESFRRKWESLADWIEVTSLYTWGDLNLDVSGDRIKRYPCAFLWYWPIVNWNGDVSMCCLDNGDGIVGNVNENTIFEIWNSKEYKRIREMHLNNEFEKIPACRNCTGWTLDPDISSRLRRLKW